MGTTPNLRGLIALARRDGVDIRPTLLRVLTDIFVQEPTHSRAEKTRFAELAGRLLDGADEATRAAVAHKLAACDDAPAEVILKLARDAVAVAAPVLLQSRVLGERDLVALFETQSLEHRQTIARRPDLPTSIAARLGELTRDAAKAFLATREHAVLPPADLTPPPVAPFVPSIDAIRPRTPAPPLAPALPRAELLDGLPRGAEAADIAARLEQAALQRRPASFLAVLEAAFGLERLEAEDILRDPSGELVALACRALDMPVETFSRIALFLDPAIGRSVAQVFALADLYRKTSHDEARARMHALRRRGIPRPTRYQPATMPDGARGRPTGDLRRSPLPGARPAERETG